MTKNYISLSTWVDKATGKPKSTLAQFSQGVNKAGQPYQITNTDSTIMVEEAHAAGTILTFNLVLATPPATQKQNLKLNTSNSHGGYPAPQ
jgi:hypothetical protein